MSSQRIGKYACLEIERRYLLNQVPESLLEQGYNAYIVDRYIIDTRLRLRRMTMASGQQLFKFTQKYQDLAQDDTETTITNIYLNEEEFGRLAQLAAREIIKRRYRYSYQDRLYSVDIFEGTLKGLILAEVECEYEAEAALLPVPSFVATEVTADPFFRGGNLATLTSDALRYELAKRLP